METCAVDVRHVTKCFGSNEVLKDVCVSFEKGKIHGIIGRNGSGKTVLLKCICGLLAVSQGEINVLGQAIGNGKASPNNIGAIIETPGFLPKCSGYQNLRYLMELQGKVDPARIMDVIERVGLDPHSKKHVGQYSLGMRQRLALAQALMDDPELLVLDEPTNGLDNNGVLRLRSLLNEQRSHGKTILIASHSAEDVRLLCDTVMVMEAGQISNQGIINPKAGWLFTGELMQSDTDEYKQATHVPSYKGE